MVEQALLGHLTPRIDHIPVLPVVPCTMYHVPCSIDLDVPVNARSQ